ncbi:MAG: helix-turn-helix domain-containing protein [Mangrovicoccus sp.]
MDDIFSIRIIPPKADDFNVAEEKLADLTDKERDVIELAVKKIPKKEIARRLGGISPHTVSSHLRRAYVKLGIHSRAELRRLMESLKD